MTVPKVLVEITEGGKLIVVSASHQIELIVADPGSIAAFGVVYPDESSQAALQKYSRYFAEHAENVKASGQ